MKELTPEWLQLLNAEAAAFDLRATVPLTPGSLLEAAQITSGLEDFGTGNWHEALSVLCQSLDDEAELSLMGRLMARNDIHQWLCNRAALEDWYKRHPEIDDEEITAPMFIVGLPRSGTSILFELLCQDPDVGVPLMWEAMYPCPPPQQASYANDPRIEKAHLLFTQWNRLVPSFASMHEMSGRIPAECGLITANTFISDHIASLHQTPSYNAYYMQADMEPVYAYHKRVLKLLQWRNPRKRWLLKAPEHQVHLQTLLQVYPDAQIVQTHRDPIKCMASTSSLMQALYKMRSDKAFDTQQFESILLGSATADRLGKVMQQRDDGIVPGANIADSRYQDLMDNPIENIANIYRHFGMQLGDTARQRMLDYLQHKPKGKFGQHSYSVDSETAKRERPLFADYQTRYGVPDEI